MDSSKSDVLVIFGVTGDLVRRKIFPALAVLFHRGQLVMPVIGVARGGWTLERLQQRVAESLDAHGNIDGDAGAALSAQLSHVDGDYRDPATYARLKQMLKDRRRPLIYLAIAPGMFETVIAGLVDAGCTANARVVVEKPFGRDLASARALNRTLHAAFTESAVFRIDHYLGKEAVQNLSYFRFANSFLEPIWNQTHVASIQLTIAEQLGMAGRGRFYEEVGAIRDVVQNHLLQVIALLTMDAPAGQDADAIRNEKLRVLRAIRPVTTSDLVRGQYRGYRDEPGVSSTSRVETFVALRLHIDTWRWSGVPIYVRSGKRLPLSATEVLVELRRPPLAVFDDTSTAASNYLRFRLSPEVVIALGTRVKRLGEPMRGEAVELVARHTRAGEDLPYERLLHDAARGDSSLFTQDQSVEAAWRVVEPALTEPPPVEEYEPGTWGPDTKDVHAVRWHNPAAEASQPC